MSLRTRLYVILGALALVPVLVGALVLVFVVPSIGSDRLESRIPTASDAVLGELKDECRLLGLTARSVALESGALTPQGAADHAVDDTYASYAAVLRLDGTTLAAAGTLPASAGPPGRLSPCTQTRGAGPVIVAMVPVQGVTGATRAVVAQTFDPSFVEKLRIRAGSGSDIVLLRGTTVVASNLPAHDARVLAASLRGDVKLAHVGDTVAYVTAPSPGAPYTVIVSGQRSGLAGGTVVLTMLILVAGAGAAGLLVSVVARSLSQPFVDLTEVAERVADRVADGDLEDLTAIVDELPQGEAGRLGDAFNRVTTELRLNMSRLEQSQDELRDSLARIGETLARTHDLEGLIRAVLDAAVVTLQARAGLVLYGAPDDLRVVEKGFLDAGLDVPTGITPGAGVLGGVIAREQGVRGTIGSGPSELNPIATEPSEGDILAVPLRSMGAVIGVIALYGRLGGKAFDASDDGALRTLAIHAGTAIDNVQLHQEAQRLSTTDGLTGLWNFRYLSNTLTREIERSTRFERPLAVLMLDLDHFKLVNDAHGHARGDTVLRELAVRVQEQIREVDTFARYGGEEFVVVLPETTVEGAGQLAQRICDAISGEPFREENEEPLDITVSIGGAAYPNHGSSAATLMRAADKALYVAKSEGRNRWHMPDP